MVSCSSASEAVWLQENSEHSVCFMVCYRQSNILEAPEVQKNKPVQIAQEEPPPLPPSPMPPKPPYKQTASSDADVDSIV